MIRALWRISARVPGVTIEAIVPTRPAQPEAKRVERGPRLASTTSEETQRCLDSHRLARSQEAPPS